MTDDTRLVTPKLVIVNDVQAPRSVRRCLRRRLLLVQKRDLDVGALTPLLVPPRGFHHVSSDAYGYVFPDLQYRRRRSVGNHLANIELALVAGCGVRLATPHDRPDPCRARRWTGIGSGTLFGVRHGINLRRVLHVPLPGILASSEEQYQSKNK